MPLHAEDGLELVALYGFDDSVGACGCHMQAGCGIAASLMVEGVDLEGRAEEFVENGAFGRGDGVGWVSAIHILTVLDAFAFHLRVDVLIDCAAKGDIDSLYAFADAQHRDLAVVGETGEEKFLEVTLGCDGVKLTDGLFAYEDRIDVSTSAEDDAVEGVKE